MFSIFHPYLVTKRKLMNLFPKGERHPFLYKLSYPILLPYPVPSAVKSHPPLPEANLLTPVLLWEGASHTQFPMENSLGTVGSSWVWAEPSDQVHPGAVSLCDPLGECLFKCPLGSFHHLRTLGLYAVRGFHLMFRVLLLVVLNQLQKLGHCLNQCW